MTAGRAVFIDANILVYAMFNQVPWHLAARDRLAKLESQRAVLWTSRQVFREFLAVSTRPGVLSPSPPVSFLAELVRGFETRFQVAEDRREITALLLDLIEMPGARGRQVHDANIVATMRRHGISSLLTHNVSDFERYRPWIDVLPLVT